MTQKFTPGPWSANVLNFENEENDKKINSQGNQYWKIKPEIFHDDYKYLDITGWMSESNARLIAAAPELLEALKGVRMHKCMFDTDEDFNKSCDAVNAAIAKAEGN